jgi:DNA-binding phage protein
MIIVGRIARSQGLAIAQRPGLNRQAYYGELKATADDSVRHKQRLMRSSLIQSLREAAATP